MFNIAKTDLTIQLERQLWSATHKMGTFGCFEVTIGIGTLENGRVDYLTFDTKGIWRCYEIKVSKADFYSKAKKTFVGHYNYFVIPKELYEEVKDDIPDEIGVYINGYCKKRAKKQDLSVEEQILKDSMIRSLCREYVKKMKSDDPDMIDRMNRQIDELKKEKDNYRQYYQDLNRRVIDKYGYRWDKD